MAEKARYHAPLLHSFRDAFEKNESSKARSPVEGDRVMSEHDVARRRGLTETKIREIVLRNLEDVFSTVDLKSAVALDGLTYVSKSVLNFGLYDIMHLTSEDARIPEIEENIAAAILRYEPRIRPESVQVERLSQMDEAGQRVRLAIYAEVSSSPLNIPLEFLAEVDLSSGKADVNSISGRI